MSSFVFGFAIGVLSVLSASYVLVIKARKKMGYKLETLKQKLNSLNDSKEDLKKKLQDDLSRKDSIKERLLKAQEITKQQLDLRAQTDMPSKNSMHSRYKNGLIGEINKLEEEKRTILESILNDGFDPIVTALDEMGNQRNISLSEFLGKTPPAENLEKDDLDISSEEITPEIKKVGKFFVIKGGKGEGGNA
jgi:hypothetical protein